MNYLIFVNSTVQSSVVSFFVLSYLLAAHDPPDPPPVLPGSDYGMS